MDKLQIYRDEVPTQVDVGTQVVLPPYISLQQRPSTQTLDQKTDDSFDAVALRDLPLIAAEKPKTAVGVRFYINRKERERGDSMLSSRFERMAANDEGTDKLFDELQPVSLVVKQSDNVKTTPKTAKVLPTVGGKPVTVALQEQKSQQQMAEIARYSADSDGRSTEQPQTKDSIETVPWKTQVDISTKAVSDHKTSNNEFYSQTGRDGISSPTNITNTTKAEIRCGRVIVDKQFRNLVTTIQHHAEPETSKAVKRKHEESSGAVAMKKKLFFMRWKKKKPSKNRVSIVSDAQAIYQSKNKDVKSPGNAEILKINTSKRAGQDIVEHQTTSGNPELFDNLSNTVALSKNEQESSKMPQKVVKNSRIAEKGPMSLQPTTNLSSTPQKISHYERPSKEGINNSKTRQSVAMETDPVEDLLEKAERESKSDQPFQNEDDLEHQSQETPKLIQSNAISPPSLKNVTKDLDEPVRDCSKLSANAETHERVDSKQLDSTTSSLDADVEAGEEKRNAALYKSSRIGLAKALEMLKADAVDIADNSTKADDTGDVADNSTKANDAVDVADNSTKTGDAGDVTDNSIKADDAVDVADNCTKPDDPLVVADNSTKPDDAVDVPDNSTKPDDAVDAPDNSTKPDDTVDVADKSTKAKLDINQCFQVKQSDRFKNKLTDGLAATSTNYSMSALSFLNQTEMPMREKNECRESMQSCGEREQASAGLTREWLHQKQLEWESHQKVPTKSGEDESKMQLKYTHGDPRNSLDLIGNEALQKTGSPILIGRPPKSQDAIDYPHISKASSVPSQVTSQPNRAPSIGSHIVMSLMNQIMSSNQLCSNLVRSSSSHSKESHLHKTGQQEPKSLSQSPNSQGNQRDQLKRDQLKRDQLKRDQLKQDQLKQDQLKRDQLKRDQLKELYVMQFLRVLRENNLGLGFNNGKWLNINFTREYMASTLKFPVRIVTCNGRSLVLREVVELFTRTQVHLSRDNIKLIGERLGITEQDWHYWSSRCHPLF